MPPKFDPTEVKVRFREMKEREGDFIDGYAGNKVDSLQERRQQTWLKEDCGRGEDGGRRKGGRMEAESVGRRVPAGEGGSGGREDDLKV